MDVTVQLLATRWFLSLWSSVLPVPTLLHVYDCLFTLGPQTTLLAALACFSVMRPSIMAATTSDELNGSAISQPLREAEPDALVRMMLRDVGTLKPSELEKLRARMRSEHAQHPAAAKRASLGASLQHEFKRMFTTNNYQKPRSASLGSFSVPIAPSAGASAAGAAAGASAVGASAVGASAAPIVVASDDENAPSAAPPKRPSRAPLGRLTSNAILSRPSFERRNSKAKAAPPPSAPVRSSTRNALPIVPDVDEEDLQDLENLQLAAALSASIVEAALDADDERQACEAHEAAAAAGFVLSPYRSPTRRRCARGEAGPSSDNASPSPLLSRSQVKAEWVRARSAEAKEEGPAAPPPRGRSGGEILPVLLTVVLTALVATSRRLRNNATDHVTPPLLMLPAPPAIGRDAALGYYGPLSPASHRRSPLHASRNALGMSMAAATRRSARPSRRQAPTHGGSERKGDAHHDFRRRHALLAPLLLPVRAIHSVLRGMVRHTTNGWRASVQQVARALRLRLTTDDAH